jgi:HEAT repeat protein
MRYLIPAVGLVASVCTAQTPKDVRAAARQGQAAIPALAGYLAAPELDTRIEAVKQLIAVGGKDIVDPLIRATRDPDPEVQVRAADGLVNYYLPGYVKTGPGSSLVRVGASIRAKFSDTNDQVIDGYVVVRPEAIAALGAMARGGSGFDSRATACRALGILRGRAAVPDLAEALRSKDNGVMYEALIALQKIGDVSAGPRVTFLLRDLDDKVQNAAIETAGLLRSSDALPTLRTVVASPRNTRIERAALAALAMMPEPRDRELLVRELSGRDDRLRAAAAEGLGRLGNPQDQPTLMKAWQGEDKMLPRLGAAFGLVLGGDLDLSEMAPFRYLINTLNSSAFREVAYAYLVEAARRKPVLMALYEPLNQGTRDEKIQLSRVLAASGDGTSAALLEKASRDTDDEVQREGLRALRSLRARLGI